MPDVNSQAGNFGFVKKVHILVTQFYTWYTFLCTYFKYINKDNIRQILWKCEIPNKPSV